MAGKSILDQSQVLKRWEPGKVKPSKSAGYRPPASNYQGAELQPFTGRAGAMDAMSVPSLMGNERRPHKACSSI